MLHQLFNGGQRTRNLDWAMFPQVAPGIDEPMESDARRSHVMFSLTRDLWFGGVSGVTSSAGPCGCGCGSTNSGCKGSIALNHYISETPIVAGDVIQTHILPRRSMLMFVHWSVESPIDPFTFDLRVRGQAASMGGTEAAPVNLVLQAGINGTVADSGVIDVSAVNGGPLYLDQNDFIEMVVNSLPPAGASSGCSDCASGGIHGLRVLISPVVMEFQRGSW